MGGRRPRKKGAERNEGLKDKLIHEFGSLLEESLMLAMLGERDVVTEYEAIRAQFRQLADAAAVEQATGFDPSGLGHRAEVEGLVSDEATTTTTGNGPSAESATTVSDGSDTVVPKFFDRADASEADKVAQLREIFPNFRDHTLAFALKTCGGVLEQAFDDLMTRQALVESGELPKGVDGFYKPEGDNLPASPKKDAKPRKAKGKQKLDLSYNVVSPTIVNEDLEGAPGSPLTRKPPRPPLAAPPKTPTWQAPGPSGAFTHAMPDMEASRASRRTAAEAAANPSLGIFARQVSAVYNDRARFQAESAFRQASVDAEALVDRQSTSTKIDLHGVTVMDGVKIAKKRVWAWWDQLGVGRQRIARQQGFTVVTGKGLHSTNGVSKLRPAVGQALINDGWKVESQGGQFYITGRL